MTLFTNKTADTMSEELQRLMGDIDKDTTKHSLMSRIADKHEHLPNKPPSTVELSTFLSKKMTIDQSSNGPHPELSEMIANMDKDFIKKGITDRELISIKEENQHYNPSFAPKPLFQNKLSEEISTKLSSLVENLSTKLSSYKSPSDKAQSRESLPDALMLAGGLIATVGIPAGMMAGKYFGNMAVGGALSAIIPAGMMIGAGLITYLNNKAMVEYVNDRDIDLPAKAKHNEKHGNDFLKKLDDLNIGDAFKDVKAVIEKSVKDPKNHPDNVILDVKQTLKKNNLQ